MASAGMFLVWIIAGSPFFVNCCKIQISLINRELKPRARIGAHPVSDAHYCTATLKSTVLEFRPPVRT